MKKKILDMLDNAGGFYDKDKYYKLDHWRGHRGIYIEVDKEQYDNRVRSLAEVISKCPDVDLLMVLTDALYDLTLKRLSKIEGDLKQELSSSQIEDRKPDIKTTDRERGTCIDLRVKGKYCLNVRE